MKLSIATVDESILRRKRNLRCIQSPSIGYESKMESLVDKWGRMMQGRQWIDHVHVHVAVSVCGERGKSLSLQDLINPDLALSCTRH